MSTENTLTSLTLANGLRVVLDRDPRWGRVGVSLAVGVGFRAEAVGEEGLAHLVEHLVHAGGPPGMRARGDSVAAVANATTHEDYTDFYHVVPSWALEDVLSSEAARFGRPRITEQVLAEQLAEVDREITTAWCGRPFGGAPWPMLPGVLYRDHARQHDGFGDIANLRRFGVDDCADFFYRQYRPDNAVLAISGNFVVGVCERLLRHHFGSIPRRNRGAGAAAAGPLSLSSDRWARHSEPHVPVALLAVATEIKDVRADPEGYLSALALARSMGEHASAATPVDATCGFFGPGDSRDSDAFVATRTAVPGVEAIEFAGEVRRWLRDPPVDDAELRAATTGLALQLELAHSDLVHRVRAQARCALLWHAPELAGQWAALARTLNPRTLRRHGARLSHQPFAGLTVHPGTSRTRPAACPGGPVRVPAVTAAEVGRDQPAPAPLMPHRRAALHRPAVTSSPAGLGRRVVTVREDRLEMVMVRFRLAWGPTGWRRPRVADQGLVALSSQVAKAVPSGMAHRVTSDGEALSIDGWWSPADVADGVQTVLELCANQAAWRPVGGQTSQIPTAGGLADLADRVLRGVCAGQSTDTGDLVADLCSGSSASVVMVGPNRRLASAQETAERWAASWPATALRASAAPGAVQRLGPLPVTGATDVASRWWGEAPAPGSAEPTAYLATAAVGAYHASRLIKGQHPVSLSRSRVAGSPRWVARALSTPDAAPHVWREVAQQAAALRTDPLTHQEVESARAFCSAQVLSASDSPDRLADVVSTLVGQGHPPEWLWELPDRLATVRRDEVVELSRHMFGQMAEPDLVVGAVPGLPQQSLVCAGRQSAS